MLAVSAYRKVPSIGPRAVRMGNAAITALGMIGDGDALGQLALLKVKVKFGGAQISIEKAADKLFLPFQGDRILSVILSKAFLLAADDKITDSTILRQLES